MWLWLKRGCKQDEGEDEWKFGWWCVVKEWSADTKGDLD